MKQITVNLLVLMIIVTPGLLVPAFVSGQMPLATDEGVSASSTHTPADNTGKNVRDKDNATLTPTDQAQGSKQDVEVTRRIRKALMKDKSLSTNAKNIKIITLNGMTTLRGPVKNAGEQERILKKATKVAGVNNVTSELEVARP